MHPDSLNAGLEDVHVEPATGAVPDQAPVTLGDAEIRSQPLTADLLFETPVEANEVPELKGDVVLFDEGVAALEDLHYLLDDMIKAGGVSQSMALEGLRIEPAFNRGLSVKRYSTVPSKTEYTNAMESLIDSIVGQIKKIIAYVRDMIGRFWEWLFGKNAPKTDQDVDKLMSERIDQTDEALEVLDDVATAVEDADTEIRKEAQLERPITLELIGGQKVSFNSLEDLFQGIIGDRPDGRRFQDFLSNPDPLIRDIVDGGPYSQMMDELARQIGIISGLYQVRAQAMQEIIQRDLQGGDSKLNDLQNLAGIKKLEQPVYFKFHNRETSPQQLIGLIAEARREMEKATTKGSPFRFETVFRRAHDIASEHGPLKNLLQSSAGLMKTFVHIESWLRETEALLGNEAVHGAEGTIKNQQLDKALMALIVTMRRDVGEMQTVLTIVETYRVEVLRVVERVVGFAQLAAEQLTLGLQRQHVEVPKQLKEILKELQDQRIQHFQKILNTLKMA